MKCVVMEVEKNYAVVLKSGGEFTKIRNKNYTVGQEITLPKHNYSSMVAVAASFVIICLSAFSGYKIYSAPDGYVSVDINPSIQLVTNRFNRVIGTQSFNGDGEMVLGQGGFKHKSVEDSIERIIDVSISLGYLSENNNNVVIDVVANDEATIEALQSKTEKYKAESIVIDIEKADENILELSKELGESVGRTKAIYEYTDVNGGNITENKEKLEKESVAEIKNNRKTEMQKPDNDAKQYEKSEEKAEEKESKINNNNRGNTKNDNKPAVKSESIEKEKDTHKIDSVKEVEEQKLQSSNKNNNNKNSNKKSNKNKEKDNKKKD